MKKLLWCFLAAVYLPLSGATTDIPVAEQLEAIKQHYTKARTELMEAFERDAAAGPVPGRLAKFFADESALLDEAVAFARAHPRTEIGFSAVKWILENGRAHMLSAAADAMAVVEEQYANRPDLAPLVAALAWRLPGGHAQGMKLFEAVIAQNPDHDTRGQAALGLALLIARDLDQSERSGDRLFAAIEESRVAFERVARDYGDCPSLRPGPVSTTLRDEVARELPALTIRCGLPAPEISGSDLDGKPMTLSEFRGKVVLLVFWASWCGPCMAAVPHEKELVARFAGRPFVLVGVNGDHSRENATKAVATNQILWRSFENGPPDTGIALAWNVRGWPATYVLDDKGIIRFRQLSGPPPEDELEKLVAAVERGQ